MGSLTRSELLPAPWRTFGEEKEPWAKHVYETFKKEVVNHELLDVANLKFFNVLLIGQISAGKSLFYNTVESVFSNHVTMRADAGAVEESLTTTFRKYKVKAVDNEKKPIRFRFCDTMGLSAVSGLTAEDLGTIMDGNVSDGANLEELGLKGYNEDPTMADQMHCVVFIVDGSQFTFVDEQILTMFNDIRKQARKRTLNPIVILTRTDMTCNELNKEEGGDIRRTFHSQTVKDLVDDVSRKLGVAKNMVYPVANYSSDTEKDLGMDILTLRALRQIRRCSETALDHMLERQEEEEDQAEQRKQVRMKKEEKRDEELIERKEAKKADRKQGGDQKKAPLPPSQNSKKAPAPPVICCTALYQRTGEDDDELDMTVGEKFRVMTLDVGNDWTLVKNNSGKTGKVPTAWLKMGDGIHI